MANVSISAPMAYSRVQSVTFCGLRADWKTHDGKLVRVHGWIYRDFEHYTLQGQDCVGGIGIDYSEDAEDKRKNGFLTEKDANFRTMVRLQDEKWPYKLPPNTACSVDCGVRKYKVFVTITGRFRAESDYAGGVRLVLVIKSVRNIKTELLPNTTPPEWRK